MGATATVIAVSYAVVVVIGVLIAVTIWRSTRSRGPADPQRLAERERAWFLVVVALLLGLLVGTIVFIPYGRGAGARHQVVEVTATQFSWKLAPAFVDVDVPVEFRLRSADVNHGFGVYTKSYRLIAQAQVVPGKTQKLVHTFHQPGVYRVLCLEFCGFGHHGMLAQFEVRG